MALHSESELSGVLLDAAVAKALGLEFELQGSKVMARFGDRPAIYSPSTDWAWGGPIVDGEQQGRGPVHGPTPLVAAVRLVVASRVGAQVDL